MEASTLLLKRNRLLNNFTKDAKETLRRVNMVKKGKWLLGMVLVFVLVLSACGGGNGNGNGNQNGNSNNGAGNGNTSSPDNTGAGAETDDVYPENGLSRTEKVTIKLAIDEAGLGRAWIDYAIENFTAKYPNVSFDITSSPKIWDSINAKLATNRDDEMYDIFPGSATSIKLIDAGKLESLEHLWEREVPDLPGVKLKDALIEGAYENRSTYQGVTYNLPVGGYSTGLFFDINFFEEHGWNQSPQTWDEFVQLLESIKAKNITPIVYAGVYPDYLYQFGFGGKPFEVAELNGTLDSFLDRYRNMKLPLYASDEYLETWKRISELGKAGYYANGVAAINHTQSQMQMLQHKAALVPSGDWIQNEMKEAIPEGFKWGYMSIPFGDKPEQTKWIIGDSGSSASMVVWSKAPELTKQWAMEFLLNFLTLDQQTYNAQHGGIFPNRGDFMDDPARVENMQDAPKAIVEYMSKNKVRVESARRDVIIDHPAIGQANQLLTESANDMALGNKDYKQVLEKMDQMLKEAIEAP